MGAFASVVAGIATIGGVVALTRLARRKADAIREELARAAQGSDPASQGRTLDYERDPEDGVYRAKS